MTTFPVPVHPPPPPSLTHGQDIFKERRGKAEEIPQTEDNACEKEAVHINLECLSWGSAGGEAPPGETAPQDGWEDLLDEPGLVFIKLPRG